MQLTFGDAEGLCKRKQTSREIFLCELEQGVRWKQLTALIEPHYPVSRRPGRQPYVLTRMLRIHLVQQWSALRVTGALDAEIFGSCELFRPYLKQPSLQRHIRQINARYGLSATICQPRSTFSSQQSHSRQSLPYSALQKTAP